MKRFLLFFGLVLAMCIPALANEATLVYADQGYSNAQDVTSTDIKDANGVVVAVVEVAQGTAQNAPKYYNTGSGLRTYSGNTMTIAMKDGRKISKAVFTFAAANYGFKDGLKYSPGTFTGLGSASQTWTADDAQTESFSLTSNATTRLQKIEITYTEGSTLLTPAGLSFPEEEYYASIGTPFEAPALTKATDAPAKYESSDENVATVNSETGEVTLVGAGTTTITASTEATEVYTAGAAFYTLTVTDPNALDVTIDFSKENSTDITTNGLNVKIEKGDGSTQPSYYTGHIRVYAKNTITVTAPEGCYLSSITFTTASSNGNFLSGASANEGSFNASNKTWSADGEEVSSVVFTNGTVSSGHTRIETMTVTWIKSADADKDPVTLSFPASEYNVLSTATFESPVLSATNKEGEDIKSELSFTYTSSNAAVATVNEEGVVTIVGAGTTVITVTSSATDIYAAARASYTLNVQKAVSSIAELYAAGKNVECVLDFEMTVTYMNGRYVYATADNAYTLIYIDTNADAPYEVGSVIPAGWVAKYSPYNGLDEIVPVGALPESSENVGFTPRTVTEVSKDMMNEIVILTDVEFAEETVADSSKNFNGTVGDTSYVFRNNFKTASVDAGTYDVMLAVGYYENAAGTTKQIQLNPIEYMAVPENLPTVDLTAVAADEEGKLIVTLAVPAGSPEHTEIWYKVEAPAASESDEAPARVETNADGFTLYTAPFEVEKGSNVSYYSSVNGRTTDTKTETVTVPTTGIEAVEVEAAEAVYYNLQGLRVENPTTGIFIRVANGRAVKVAL